MKKRKYQKWMFTYAGIGGLIGNMIAQMIKGQWNLSGFLGALTASIVLFSIDIIRARLKKDKTPDFDERTTNNMLKFYAYASNIFIGMIFLSLTIITLLGHETIPVAYLWIIVMSYFFISGLGALIVSKK